MPALGGIVSTTGVATEASPALSGVPTAPTAAVDTNTTQLATTAYVVGQAYAKLASPTFTGTPAAPTAAVGTSTTQLATTAYVVAQTSATVLSAQTVLDVGVAGQIRAGRELVATDFTTLLGLSQPVGLWDAGSLVNLGSGGNLTNKGAVPLTAKGVNGTANHAALFAGSTGQALYIADGSGGSFNVKTGSMCGWSRTAKRATAQAIVSKWGATAATESYLLYATSGNVAALAVTVDGVNVVQAIGVTDVCDDRWHHVCGTYDGSVLRLYVDGALEASTALAGTLTQCAAPFNVGATTADNLTAASSPHFGRIAVPFVTADVLSEDQIRVLMAAKVAHGYAVTPTRSRVGVRRKRKGAVLLTTDFTATPKRLYNMNATGAANVSVTDSGSNAANISGGSSTPIAGPDGLFNFTGSGGAGSFNGTSDFLSATDAGLPATTAARTIGAWFKCPSTAGTNAQRIVSYGTDVSLYYWPTDGFAYSDANGGPKTTSVDIRDGQWHFGVVVVDNAAADGLKKKLYYDGRLVATDTTAPAGTLAGAGAFRIGMNAPGGSFFNGAIARAFVTDYAMAEDEILSLFAKGSVALPASEKAQGDNVEAMDATNVYVLFDDLDSQHSVDLRVAA